MGTTRHGRVLYAAKLWVSMIANGTAAAPPQTRQQSPGRASYIGRYSTDDVRRQHLDKRIACAGGCVLRGCTSRFLCDVVRNSILNGLYH